MIRSAVLAVLVLAVPSWPTEPPPLAEITAPATASSGAERLDPAAAAGAPAPGPLTGDSSSRNGRCVGWEPLLEAYSPGWDVARMSRIAYRESRCQPRVRNPSGATGLLQLMPLHCRWLPEELGEQCSVAKLQEPHYAIRAAAALWARDGYRPWNL